MRLLFAYARPPRPPATQATNHGVVAVTRVTELRVYSVLESTFCMFLFCAWATDSTDFFGDKTKKYGSGGLQVARWILMWFVFVIWEN
jgi:hypothetical protein